MSLFGEAPTRAGTRRGQAPTYFVSRTPRKSLLALQSIDIPPAAGLLTEAGATASALRRELRRRGIDPRLARLTLIFGWQQTVCVSDAAWRLAIHPSTASRWFDRAEQQRLLDKLYDRAIDHRRTYGQLTDKGRRYRKTVIDVLRGVPPLDRPGDTAYGGRRRVPMCEGWG